MNLPVIQRGSSGECAKESLPGLGITQKLRCVYSTCSGGRSDNLFVQELAKYSPVPVLNALSSLWHPTQILADILTLHEHAHLFNPSAELTQHSDKVLFTGLPNLRPLTIAYVGDPANVLNDMLVTYPRLGHKLRIASPPAYQCAPPVWQRVKELGCEKDIWWGSDPREAVHGADVVITDTW
jgi:ornithine carbamoyltransferase